MRSIYIFFVVLPRNSAGMKKITWIVMLMMLLMAVSCRQEVEYPIEPRITYNGFTYIFNADSTFSGQGILSFDYTDGDGDLGLDDADEAYPFGPNDPYYYNMVVDYFKSVNGEFVKMPLVNWNQQTQQYDTVSFNSRFKRLMAGDEAKPISGTIEYTMLVQNPFSPNDTIMFEVHILDRALHESNVIQTQPIITNLHY